MTGVLIIDFGSQFTRLIKKQLDTLGYKSSVIPWNSELLHYHIDKAAVLILSGGPASVYKPGAPRYDFHLSKGKPTLGICYGMQLIVQAYGGKIAPGFGTRSEYGKSQVTPVPQGAGRPWPLLSYNKFNAWMSHGDVCTNVPPGFDVIGKCNDGSQSMVAAIRSETIDMVGLQFHPEVEHTEGGKKILGAFVSRYVTLPDRLTNKVPDIFISPDVRKSKKKIVCAVSGGIDSALAYEVLKAELDPKRLIPVTIDTGLLRCGEIKSFAKLLNYGNLEIIDASEQMFQSLTRVTDPEAKRRAIGRVFAEYLDIAVHKHKTNFLMQGTIYPDVIESSGVNGTAAKIKSHHNVGGLPKHHGFTLVEPLRALYKDDVRRLAEKYKINLRIVNRMPFPGPGLGIRIIGEVTRARVAALQTADKIVRRNLMTHEGPNPWQLFCVLLPDVKSVGVKGDARSYDATIAIRSVNSVDGMTATVHPHSIDDLTRTADEIVNSIPGIGRVVYDLTSKPPGTIEWE